MRALDTNVIVRYLTGDDEAPATRARAVVDAGQVFVQHRTAGERVGVAERLRFAADEVADALRASAGLPGVALETAHEPCRVSKFGEDMHRDDFAIAVRGDGRESRGECE